MTILTYFGNLKQPIHIIETRNEVETEEEVKMSLI